MDGKGIIILVYILLLTLYLDLEVRWFLYLHPWRGLHVRAGGPAGWKLEVSVSFLIPAGKEINRAWTYFIGSSMCSGSAGAHNPMHSILSIL